MKKVAILHSDFGIGGAERLILDVGLGLKENGYNVEIFTNYFNKKRCFDELKNDKIKVFSYFGLLPLTIFGKFYVLISLIKMFLLGCIVVCKNWYKREYDFIVTDGAGYITIPLFKLFGFPVFFYCHFPDQLLNTNQTLLSKVYRFPIDMIEEFCTSLMSILMSLYIFLEQADVVAANSEFTKRTTLNLFHSIDAKAKKNPDFFTILYPCVNVDG